MSFIDKILAIIAPHDCLGCAVEGSLLCKSCLNSLPPIAPKRLNSACLNFVYSATPYNGVAKDLIWQLKSSGAQEAGQIMATEMLKLLPDDKKLLIVPVPTTTGRIRQRGYDQAGLLAKELSRQTRLPYANLLIRHGKAHQVGADREQRLSQLSTAFRVKPGKLIKGRHIVLIDDVVTTGATLEAAAKILIEAGVHKITAITFAQPLLRVKQLRSRGW